MRGKGWGKKHKTVDYVWKYGWGRLFCYHLRVMNEMLKRNYNVEKKWFDISYAGKQRGYLFWVENKDYEYYPEHNDEYLQECLDNLKAKGIIINLKQGGD